jgi:hypothetical protein
MTDAEFAKAASKTKIDSAVKVQIEQAVICDKVFAEEHKNGTMTQAVEKSIKEALEWYSLESTVAESSRSEFYQRIQDVILSRLYSLRVKESGNYHWHIAVSEVHPENENALHALFTNHFGIVNDPKNKKEPIGDLTLTTLHTKGIELNYYCEASVTFNVQVGGHGPNSKQAQIKPKRLSVVLFNQSFHHTTGIEKVISGSAFSSVGEFISSIFSFRGLQTLLFMMMVAVIFLGNKFCKGINEEAALKVQRLELEHKS